MRTFLWLRKIDLANIYLMIAGSCTPLAYAITPGSGRWLLPAMWIAAALGIAKALLWSRGHRAINAGLYVLMGALTLPCLSALKAAVNEANLEALAREPVTAEELARVRTQALNDWDTGFADPERVGVAAIPMSAFLDPDSPDSAEWNHLVRFAFCKRDDTLDEAISRLRTL